MADLQFLPPNLELCPLPQVVGPWYRSPESVDFNLFLLQLVPQRLIFVMQVSEGVEIFAHVPAHAVRSSYRSKDRKIYLLSDGPLYGQGLPN